MQPFRGPTIRISVLYCLQADVTLQTAVGILRVWYLKANPPSTLEVGPWDAQVMMTSEKPGSVLPTKKAGLEFS